MATRSLLADAQITVTPSAEGLPGGEFVGTMLGWLAQVTLWGSVASMLLGGAIWGASQWYGGGQQVATGRRLAGGGFIGAALAALAAPIVNAVFTGAGG